jgi:[ribosomal protein S18]-alanine N-acetyltransferase
VAKSRKIVAPKIRLASKADLSQIVQLEQATFTTDRVSPRQWQFHLHNVNACVLVADLNELVLAAALIFYRRKNKLARLFSIAVSAQARGMGLGGKLLQRCVEQARKHGSTRMRLEVRERNVIAINLYEKFGFKVIAQLPAYYADGAAGVRLQKEL